MLFFFLLASCKTYYIPVESFKKQFSGIDASQLKEVRTQGPAYELTPYPANQIRMIQCEDNKGNKVMLPNGPSIETRITTRNGKRTIFYFDRLFLQHDTLVGYRSRFLGLPKKIPLSDITKIEVQDGHKNFRYTGQ